MARPYKLLWIAMASEDVDERVLARELSIAVATASSRLNNHSPWRQDEMYKILDMLGRPDSDLPVLFPRNGQNEEGCSRGRVAGRGTAVAGRRAARG